MLPRIRSAVLRLIGPLVAGFVTWLGSLGIELPAEFGDSATTALVVLAMGVLTVVVNWLVRALGPVASFIFGIEREE